MAGRRKSNPSDAGCGTLIAFLLVVGFISAYWRIIAVIVAVILVIYGCAIYWRHKKSKIESNVADDMGEIKTLPPVEIEENDIVLRTGRYVATRDISPGIYDVKVVSGSGFIKTNAPVELQQYFDRKDGIYNNLEISAETTVTVDSGLEIALCNKREYIDQFGLSYDEEKEIFREADIDKLDGHEFEYYCAEILRRQSYTNVKVTQGSGDQGVDVLAEREGIRYAVQCKRYSQPVGNKAVQEIYSGMKYYHCHVGIIMTNNYFTSSAKQLAKENGIVLWDRDYLLRHAININSQQFTHDTLTDNTIPIYNTEEDSAVINSSICEKNKNNKVGNIYPPGIYIAGEDIELGRYFLRVQNTNSQKGEICIYEDCSAYEKKRISKCDSFDFCYYLAIRENGMVVSVSNAEIRKI